jgi:hypothetical protein
MSLDNSEHEPLMAPTSLAGVDKTSGSIGRNSNGYEKNKGNMKIVIGIVCLLVAAVSRAIATAAVQLLGGFVPEFELNFCRYLTLFVLAMPILVGQKCRTCITTKYECLWLIVLGFVWTIANYTLFEAAEHLSAQTLIGVGISGTRILLFAWSIVSARRVSVTGLIAITICVLE